MQKIIIDKSKAMIQEVMIVESNNNRRKKKYNTTKTKIPRVQDTT